MAFPRQLDGLAEERAGHGVFCPHEPDQLPTTSGAVRRRSVASALSGVILPVRGFSSEGMFSIVMVRSAESDRTAMVCVLRVTVGSAHTSTSVASGPMPA